MTPKRRKHLIPHAVNPIRQIRVMGRFVRRLSKQPGSAPGTLVHTGPVKVEKVRIRFFDYDAEAMTEEEVENVERCFALKDLPTVSWINIDGLHDVELIQRVGEYFGWHPLVLEDIVATGQRAKVEEFDDHVYIVVPMLSWDAEQQQVLEEQLSLIVSDDYVFTFQERVGDVFEGVRARIRAGRTRIRNGGTDYLAYALIDAAVDHYVKVLEHIGELTERLEIELLEDPKEATMYVLHGLKRELIAMRRAVRPVRDLMSEMHRSETSPLSEKVGVFLRDVHDQTVQTMDSIEALRDVVSGMVDLYMSTVSFRTNEVMKVLTIMASIFIPLTFFAGIYGMNFDYMPELGVRWAYPMLLVLMIVVATVMVAYFRRKGWF